MKARLKSEEECDNFFKKIGVLKYIKKNEAEEDSIQAPVFGKVYEITEVPTEEAIEMTERAIKTHKKFKQMFKKLKEKTTVWYSFSFDLNDEELISMLPAECFETLKDKLDVLLDEKNHT